MSRGNRWVVAGALAAGLLATSARAEDRPKSEGGPAMRPEMAKCLKECVNCAKECEGCFQHCTTLVSQGHKEHLTTVRTCIDCGELCAVAAKLIARNGAFQSIACEACAKACDGCAAACDQHAAHDEVMKRCGDACKTCAQACREMVQAGGPPHP
jgi:hypothetical protein